MPHPDQSTINMLRTIALESTSLKQFASRAEAYNSTLATPMTDDYLSRYFPLPPAGSYIWSTPMPKTRNAIRKARTERLAGRERLWNSMAAGL